MDSSQQDTLFPRARAPIGWALLFLLFVAGIFNYPHLPTVELDSSWRMAFGYFFQQKFQMGRDIVFNYGPLGFAMGKTYSGLQFAAIVIAQLATALLGAGLILHEGRRMQGLSRWAFFCAMFFFGISYEDAMQMIVIALAGFQLLRGENRPAGTVGLGVALAILSTVKFTNLMLAGLVAGAALLLALWRGRRTDVWLIGASFGGGFLAAWVAWGQNPLNLWAYFRGSWEISQGYNASMGITTPWPPLWKAMIVLGVLAGYLLAHLKLNPDKPRALANAIVVAGFIFLNWKHGFVRSDGHMIGFFFCALLPLSAYPALLDDPAKFRRTHYFIFLVTSVVALWGIESSLYHTMRSCMGIMEGKVWNNLERTFDPGTTKIIYRDRLYLARESVNLTKTREVVGSATVDVLGFEQAVALFNDLNYRPRPIFQSYSVFTPYLGKLNSSYYEGDSAPQYVLVKVQAIDGRMPMMDDSAVWRLFPHRYEYVHTERNFQLWRRVVDKFDPATVASKPLLTVDLPLGEKLSLEAYKGKQIWARIDLKQSLIGRLHGFLYKPIRVQLVVTDATGNEREYLLPLPIGSQGFILSPLVEDAVAFAGFASGRPGREARSLSLKVKQGEHFLFTEKAKIELSELTPGHAADRFFTQTNEQAFYMFKSYPVQYESHTPLSEAAIGDRPVAVLHAPSEMIFNLPDNAQIATGSFGYLAGAYTSGGNTNGAEFIIYWSNGGEKVELFRRMLDPVQNPADQGLHNFKVPVGKLRGGRLYLRIEPGPYGNYAWDWTCWTGIEIK